MNENQKILFFSGENIPLEMHRTRMVQRITLLHVQDRLKAIQEAGNNTFLLHNKDIYLDMLTDSGVNAMSDQQYAAMMSADDSYAGSETFYRLETTLKRIFGTEFFLPTHQGRACENILANVFVSPGSTSIMNYHFTTTKAHILRHGGKVVEVVNDDSLNPNSTNLFKGNLDMEKLKVAVDEAGKENISFIRIEAGTNLIGGQPISMQNMHDVSDFCKQNNLILVFDASLLADNLYFISTREEKYIEKDLGEITLEILSLMDITYFSARKLGCARGGGIITNNEKYYLKMRPLIPLFEGFLTYGGMSIREMEALNVGLLETLDFHMISQSPMFIEALGRELLSRGVPVVTPFGGMGCHLNAREFVSHIPQSQYPAASLTAAIYIISGIRGNERGTMSEERNEDGTENFARMELVRLAVPKRVFSLSHMKYAIDRIEWLYKNRELIGGMEFQSEPAILRLFLGRLRPVSDWQERLMEQFLIEMPSGI